MSKLQFTCSEEHLEEGYLFLRFFQNCFRTLSDNRPDLWREFSTALPKVHSACPKNFSIFFAVICHVLFDFRFERKKILVLKKKFRQFCQICILNVGDFLKKLSKTIFFQLKLDFDAKCLELPTKSFQQSCQNCFLRVQWTTLRTIIVFSEIFESFWTLSDNFPDLWLKISAAIPNVHSTCRKYFFGFFCEWFSCSFYLRTQAKKILVLKRKFRHFCWNCILSVPRIFWGVFIKNVLVFQFSVVFQAKFSWTPGGNISAVVKDAFWAKTFQTWAKLLKRIVKNAFHVSRGTLWRKYCWLHEINSTFGRKFFGFAPENLLDCCHMSTICFQMAN